MDAYCAWLYVHGCICARVHVCAFMVPKAPKKCLHICRSNIYTCKNASFLSHVRRSFLDRWGPRNGRGYVANPPTCGPLPTLSVALKLWGSPRQGLCSQSAHLWATASRGYVANSPTCGPLLTLFPALKCWGARRQEGLCSQCAHPWTTADFVPGSEALLTP